MHSVAVALNKLWRVFFYRERLDMAMKKNMTDSPSRILDAALLLAVIGSIAILFVVLMGPSGLFSQL